MKNENLNYRKTLSIISEAIEALKDKGNLRQLKITPPKQIGDNITEEIIELDFISERNVKTIIENQDLNIEKRIKLTIYPKTIIVETSVVAWNELHAVVLDTSKFWAGNTRNNVAERLTKPINKFKEFLKS